MALLVRKLAQHYVKGNHWVYAFRGGLRATTTSATREHSPHRKGSINREHFI